MPDRNPRLTAAGQLLHPCRVCGAPGSFGFGVRLLKGQLGTWYCGDHRPGRPAHQAAAPAPAPAGQMSLFGGGHG